MNFIEIANTEARGRAEADPNVAVILVGPDDRFALSDMIREDGLEISHTIGGPKLQPLDNSERALIPFGAL